MLVFHIRPFLLHHQQLVLQVRSVVSVRFEVIKIWAGTEDERMFQCRNITIITFGIQCS